MSRALVLAGAALWLLAACDLPDDRDEEYMRGFCRATAEYSNALQTETNREGLERATAEYAAALEALSPPGDAAAWHGEYVAYVRAGASGRSPGAEPPDPGRDLRRRLESAAGPLDECDGEEFFRR